MPKKRKEKRNSLYTFLFACFITTFIVVGWSLSKYQSTMTMKQTTKVAVMANDVQFVIEDMIQGYPGCPDIVYPIILTNKQENNICEISQTFTIDIQKQETENLPLQIGLYEDEACTKKLEENADGLYTAEDFRFQAATEETKTYYVKINWPIDKNSAYYAFEMDYFKMHIQITQVD